MNLFLLSTENSINFLSKTSYFFIIYYLIKTFNNTIPNLKIFFTHQILYIMYISYLFLDVIYFSFILRFFMLILRFLSFRMSNIWFIIINSKTDGPYLFSYFNICLTFYTFSFFTILLY